METPGPQDPAHCLGRAIRLPDDIRVLLVAGFGKDDLGAVSYTHLTLPTIYSV